MVHNGEKRFYELGQRGGFIIRIDKRVYSWYEQEISGLGRKDYVVRTVRRFQG